MNSTSIKIVYRPSSKNKNVGSLHVRTITNRKAKFKSLKLTLRRSHWDEENQKVLPSLKSHYKEYNSKIAEVLNELSENYNNIEVLKASSTQVLEYWLNHIRTIGNPTTSANHRTAYNNFETFLISVKSPSLKLSEVNPTIVKHFHSFLSEDKEGSTVKTYLSCLKAIINHAVKEQIVSFRVHPFINVPTTPKQRKKVKALNRNEITKFISVELPQKEDYYRNMFLFSLFAGGLRVKDLMLLKWENIIQQDGGIYLSYKQQKTDKPIVSKLSLKALKFLCVGFNRTYSKEIDQLLRALTEQEIQQQRLIRKSQDYEKYEDFEVDEGNEDDELVDGILEPIELMATLRLRVYRTQEMINKLVMFLVNKHLPQHSIFKIFKEELPSIQRTQQDKNRILNGTTKVNRYLKKICVKAEVPVISSHSARHTYAQLLVNENTNVHHVQMLLGHSSLAITQNYIQSLHTSHLDHINDNLAKLF